MLLVPILYYYHTRTYTINSISNKKTFQQLFSFLKKKETDVNNLNINFINSRVNFVSQLIIYSLGIKRCKSEENEKTKNKKGIRQQQQQKIVGVLEGWTRCRVDGKDMVHTTHSRAPGKESLQ